MDTEWSWTSVLSTLTLALLLFLAYLWKQKNQHSLEGGNGAREEAGSVCKSPTCMRCHLHDQKAIKAVLLERAADYAGLAGEAAESIVGYMEVNYPRVLSTFQSIDHKDDILKSVYEHSGYKVELSAFQQHTHIWTIPGIRKMPFWSKEDVIPQTTIDHLKSVVFRDYKRAIRHTNGWKINSIPSGSWRLYQLYDQGTKSESNCAHCPETVGIIEALPNFMEGVAFGNAMFSVLEPGSRIEAHCGPCNFRLRCHLPVATPPPAGFSIQVGSCVEQWRTGQLMVFDDSFVHEVWHEQQPSSSIEEEEEEEEEERATAVAAAAGDSGGSSRVVLIVDVWHPDVREHERALLKHTFGFQ